MNSTTIIDFQVVPIRNWPVRGFYRLISPRGAVPTLYFNDPKVAEAVGAELSRLKLSPTQMLQLLSSPLELRAFAQRILDNQTAQTIPDEVILLLESLEAIGWSQAQLARKLQLDPNTVSRWITARTPVPAWVLEYLRALRAVKDLAKSLDL